jgi:hypothetical protein
LEKWPLFIPLSLYNLVFINAEVEQGATEASRLRKNALFVIRMPVRSEPGIEFLNTIYLNLMFQVIKSAILNNLKMYDTSHGGQDIVLCRYK